MSFIVNKGKNIRIGKCYQYSACFESVEETPMMVMVGALDSDGSACGVDGGGSGCGISFYSAVAGGGAVVLYFALSKLSWR